MGQAFYRKHRPKRLSEVVGQEHITDTLAKAIKSGRISHAYLFTGPKGVGKTSIARILAHEINGLPYTDESTHIDIIEIDAASNRRIDEIRELRDKVYVAPTSAKYKVYIIDEVHMLTREAFNALLKTLEEPPEHVVFILATTDAHKLPETIISRTQRFIFRPYKKEQVVKHLKYISAQEKIKVSDEALALMAEHGEGSFRDSISLLDQASSHGKKIEVADVQTLLGIPPEMVLNKLIGSLQTGTSEVMQDLLELYEQGYQAAAIAKQLGLRLRASLAQDHAPLGTKQTLELLGKLIEVPASHDPERFLEIILLQSVVPTDQSLSVSHPTKSMNPETVLPAKEPTQTKAATKTTERAAAPANVSGIIDLSIWPEVLAALKKKHNTVYSVARMGQPSITDNGVVRLAFAFAFHQKRMNDTRNRQLLADTIAELTGQQVSIECIYDKDLAQNLPAGDMIVIEPAEPNPALDTISNIFGGGELLES